MTKKTTVILILIVVTLLVAAVATYKVVQKNKNTINEETKEIFSSESKDFTYTDINGNEVSLEQYLGKILVVTSWASWSPFSKNDLGLFLIRQIISILLYRVTLCQKQLFLIQKER